MHHEQQTSKDPRNNQHNPRYANYWALLTPKRHPPQPAQPQYTNNRAPRTRKQHQQEHKPQRPTERTGPTQHAKGRTGHYPGPRKETATRRNVAQGGRTTPIARPRWKGFGGEAQGLDHALHPQSMLSELGIPESDVFTEFTNSQFWSPDGLEATAPVFSSSAFPQLPSPLGQVFATFENFKRLPVEDRVTMAGVHWGWGCHRGRGARDTVVRGMGGWVCRDRGRRCRWGEGMQRYGDEGVDSGGRGAGRGKGCRGMGMRV